MLLPTALFSFATSPTWILAIQEGTDAGTQGPPPNAFLAWMPMILIGVLAWFLLIAPERKRQKERQIMLASLGKNDKVVTVGGLIGVITKVDDHQVTLRIADGVHVHVQRASIAGPHGTPTAPKETPREDAEG